MVATVRCLPEPVDDNGVPAPAHQVEEAGRLGGLCAGETLHDRSIEPM
jgi:hypothetical protein